METAINLFQNFDKPYKDDNLDKALWSMYDNMPYISDKDVCNKHHLKRFSGNVVKYYRCQTAPPYEVKH